MKRSVSIVEIMIWVSVVGIVLIMVFGGLAFYHGCAAVEAMTQLDRQRQVQAEQTATIACGEYAALKVETLSTSPRTCYKVQCLDAKEQRMFDRYACVEEKK